MPYEQVGTVEGLPEELGLHQGILFTFDGHLFLAEDPSAKFVRLWDARTLKPVTEPLGHPDPDAFSVSSDGRTVFTTSRGEVRVWDVATSKLRSAVKADAKRLSFFDSSTDGRQFLTISDDLRTLTVWNNTAAEPVKAFHVWHSDGLDSAQFDASGEYVVDNEFAGPFDLLRARTGREVCPPITTGDQRHMSSAPYQAQFDPTGRRLAVPIPGGFRLLDSGSGKILAEPHWDPDVEAAKISFSPDGSLVAVATFDWRVLECGEVFVFETATARRVSQFGHNIMNCQISPGGRLALCNHAKNAAPELIDLHNGTRIQSFPDTHDGSHTAVMSPNGQTILVGSDHKTISVWRLQHSHPATRP